MNNIFKSKNHRGCTPLELVIFNLFKKHFIYLFLERGEGREKGTETNIDILPPIWAPTGD